MVIGTRLFDRSAEIYSPAADLARNDSQIAVELRAAISFEESARVAIATLTNGACTKHSSPPP